MTMMKWHQENEMSTNHGNRLIKIGMMKCIP